MTSRCLWHACRALALGLLLMLIGAGMATIGLYQKRLNSLQHLVQKIKLFSTNLGYYAEHILPHTETRNNSTVRVKPDSKGIHLHNLSYAGPIVMGCGGKHSRNIFLHNFIFLVWFLFVPSMVSTHLYFILFETKSQFNLFFSVVHFNSKHLYKKPFLLNET